MKNRFRTASGQRDGVHLSRFRRHGEAPFGKQFAYTDPMDLRTEIDGYRLPWYRRLWSRKRPVGWAVVEPGQFPQAYLAPPETPRVSPIKGTAMVKVFDQTVIIGATEYDREDADA